VLRLREDRSFLPVFLMILPPPPDSETRRAAPWHADPDVSPLPPFDASIVLAQEALGYVVVSQVETGAPSEVATVPPPRRTP